MHYYLASALGGKTPALNGKVR